MEKEYTLIYLSKYVSYAIADLDSPIKNGDVSITISGTVKEYNSDANILWMDGCPKLISLQYLPTTPQMFDVLKLPLFNMPLTRENQLYLDAENRAIEFLHNKWKHLYHNG